MTTRSGTRRSGDDYQDIIALQTLVEWLAHPTRYDWVQVEADDAGALDDIVAVNADGKSVIARQVKYSMHPDDPKDAWTFEQLLYIDPKKKRAHSLLQKWFTGWSQLKMNYSVRQCTVVTNRKAGTDLAAALRTKERTIDLDKIEDAVKSDIIKQLSVEPSVREFFSELQFQLDSPTLDDIEDSVLHQFTTQLGGTREGWLNLKDTLRRWIRDGQVFAHGKSIFFGDVRRAARWRELSPMPQGFEIPDDFVVPSKDFHNNLVSDVLAGAPNIRVIQGNPGVGKSTYLSHLVKVLNDQGLPVIRHHYFLSLTDPTKRRWEHLRIAESLIAGLKLEYEDSLGDLATKSLSGLDLNDVLRQAGGYFDAQGKSLVLVIDGLDHVWCEHHPVDELDLFFEWLLPPPAGVVIVIGTQPIPDERLPRLLVNLLPKDHWNTLPLFGVDEVKEWLGHYISQFPELQSQDGRPDRLHETAVSLHQLSGGFPLHLRYTLRTIQEQGLDLTPYDLRSLPKAPHGDITRYYSALWNALSIDAQLLLKVLNVCRYPWREEDILGCMNEKTLDLSRWTSAMREIRHLVSGSGVGMFPYHGSLYFFVSEQENSEPGRNLVRRLVLDWLETPRSSEYLRWAYSWTLSAELGDPTKLVREPSRAWVVDATSSFRDRTDVIRILDTACHASLDTDDIPRTIELGFLRDYYYFTREHRSDDLHSLLRLRLLSSYDPASIIRNLEDALEHLSVEGVAAVADYYLSNGADIESLEKCCSVLLRIAQRARIVNRGESHDDWPRAINPYLKAMAYVSDAEITDAMFGSFVRHRDNGHDVIGLRAYCDGLLKTRKVSLIRQLLDHDLTPAEADVASRYYILCGVLEQAKLASHVDLEKLSCCCEYWLRTALGDPKTSVQFDGEFPDVSLLDAEETGLYWVNDDIAPLLRNLYFVILTYCLSGRSDFVDQWIEERSTEEDFWPYIDALFDLARWVSAQIADGKPPSFPEYFEKMESFGPQIWPSWRRMLNQHGYAVEALQLVVLDSLILTNRLSDTKKLQAEEILRSGQCNKSFRPRTCLEILLSWDCRFLAVDSLAALAEQVRQNIDTKIDYIEDRALALRQIGEAYGLLGQTDDARKYLGEICSVLYSHGFHKDTVISDCLEVLEACGEHDPAAARRLLLIIGPAAIWAPDYTDRDGTSHLPSEFGKVMLKVAPEWVPTYVQWLIDEKEFYHATNILHDWLRTTDLSDPVNQALASSAADDTSIEILERRGASGDVHAFEILKFIRETVDGRIPEYERYRGDGDRHSSKVEEAIVNPSDYAPNQIGEFLQATNKRYSDQKRLIAEWVTHWSNVGMIDDVVAAVQSLISDYQARDFYHPVFKAVLAEHGKTAAYEWLLKAQRYQSSWRTDWADDTENKERWTAIRDSYPERWLDFVKKTLLKLPDDTAMDAPTMYGTPPLLVRYCFFVGHSQEALEISETFVNFVADLVKDLYLPVPAWMHNVK